MLNLPCWFRMIAEGNAEVIQVIQRFINNGNFTEAVENINIVCAQPGRSSSLLHTDLLVTWLGQ